MKFHSNCTRSTFQTASSGFKCTKVENSATWQIVTNYVYELKEINNAKPEPLLSDMHDIWSYLDLTLHSYTQLHTIMEEQ